MFSWIKTTKVSFKAGFSLIEMLVVLSIIAIVTAVTLSSLPSFRDNISIDLVASQVSTIARQAQVYGASQLGSAGFGTNYGLSFSSNSKDFFLYTYTGNQDNSVETRADAPKQTYTLSGDIIVSKISTVNSEISVVDAIDVIYLQRYPEPVFYKDTAPQTALGRVDVTLYSPRSKKCKDVQFWANGQISTVNNADPASCP